MTDTRGQNGEPWRLAQGRELDGCSDEAIMAPRQEPVRWKDCSGKEVVFTHYYVTPFGVMFCSTTRGPSWWPPWGEALLTFDPSIPYIPEED